MNHFTENEQRLRDAAVQQTKSNTYTTQLQAHREDMLLQPTLRPPVKPRKSDRKLIPWILTVIGIIVSVSLVFLLTGNTPTTSHVLKSPAIVKVVAKPAPVAVAQPDTAAQVAKSLNCTSFKDLGPSAIGGSIDSGSCYIHGSKYAINTFATKAVRDSWLAQAEQLGVVPKWETPTSVTYPSVP